LNPHKPDKSQDRIAQCNPKVYDGKLYPLGFEEWIRGMVKMFTIVKVPEDKKVNIGPFHYLIFVGAL